MILRRSVLLLLLVVALPSMAANPASVTLAGSLQSELGCPNDWEPGCGATHLTYDAEDDVWQRTFELPGGNWEYKAALNGSWDENYGANAQLNGANIGLFLENFATVKFFYDHKSHWITSNRNTTIVTAPGSYQSEIGCGGDWAPDCLRSWLQDPDGNGVYTATLYIPAGDYEVKAALNESWSVNYGAGGVQDGPNIPFTVGNACAPTLFSYDATTHVLTVAPATTAPQPNSVTIPGSFQSEVGCANDWDPACHNTHLTLDTTDQVWTGTFSIPAGNWEYKAALNDNWDVNYGANAQPNGSNLTLNLGSQTNVKFYYDNSTHWVADNVSKVIATVPGNYQHFLGCNDWDPSCLRSWLQDPDGDNLYTFSTRSIPAGNYEAKVAINESWDLNYGAGGAQNGANIAFTVTESCAETFFVWNATTHVLTITAAGAPKGNLAKAQAYFVTRNQIAWNVPQGAEVTLHVSPTGELALGDDGVSGGSAIPLTHDPNGLSDEVKAKFPHLANLNVWRMQDGVADGVLKGQLAVSAKNVNELLDATSLQIAGVLDDLYTYNGSLGVIWSDGTPTLAVWAPTAWNVTLHLYDTSTSTTSTTHVMTRDAKGVWSITGDPSWNGKYYLYEVEVYVRSTNKIEHNFVTDPYSVSLSRNSTRSHIVNLNDPALKPAGWDELAKPPLEAPEDITLYELHVRDFSASDFAVPAEERGTFLAFTNTFSNGMQHLASLAAAGLTHVHLLPAFDIATINEDRNAWQSPGDLSIYPPDSDQQQAAIMAIRDQDGFNWGYDPLHYTVPEGSYSTHPDGSRRILEFRRMVQALSGIGLRTVMDVVYNHTNAAGQNEKSVLDRIVPGYYHRLNADGNIEMSSCCPNTASEHNMMEKLMIDSVLTWVHQYKVDGFRFDLMGHHMKRNMTRLRDALDALTPASSGVDGKKVYVYGEGWNFGEVANNARGENAIQANMAGTGIGTFNDRIRDGVRGGGPFDPLQAQGFASGLSTDPNGTNQGSPQQQLDLLLLETDWIRASMAGNLASHFFLDRNGNVIRADQLDYKGQPAGYTDDPQESINYVEAHDNETLYDAFVLKLPITLTMDQRIRAQSVALSIVALSQGIPFFHAGGELLRSKSLDRNSYNSGDWFNRLDYSYMTNNFGRGLPPASDNQSNWPLFRPLLANPALRPTTSELLTMTQNFRELLAIRRSSPLFRLRTASDMSHVFSFNGGPNPIPGLLATLITDANGAYDRQHDRAMILINASGATLSYSVPSVAAFDFRLHPIQAASADPIVGLSAYSEGTFTIPARTTAVFLSNRPLVEQVIFLKRDVHEHAAEHQTSLDAKLDAAIRFIERGFTGPAANQLRAFINEVEALRLSGRITSATAALLTREANAILGAM